MGGQTATPRLTTPGRYARASQVRSEKRLSEVDEATFDKYQLNVLKLGNQKDVTQGLPKLLRISSEAPLKLLKTSCAANPKLLQRPRMCRAFAHEFAKQSK